MKKNGSKRIIAGFLAVLMLVLLVPFSAFTTFAAQTNYTITDYTPLLLESVDGAAVYNAQTAGMCFELQKAAEKYVSKNAGESLSSVPDKGFSYSYNGISYYLDSVYMSDPAKQSVADAFLDNTCGFLVGMINYTDINGRAKHVMLVSFSGTQKNVGDITTDLNFFPEKVDDNHWYHKGFYNTANNHYQSIKSKTFSMGNGEKYTFDQYVSKLGESGNDYQMIVTGHSLGAAVANIFTSYFVDARSSGAAQKNSIAYAFATPLTSSDGTASKTNVKNVFNFVNLYDWVPKVGYGIVKHNFDMAKGAREGYDLTYVAGDSSVSLFSFANHAMSSAIYGNIMSQANVNIVNHTDAFVLYNNYDKTTNTYQRIVFNNGQLIVSGSGDLAGNWADSSLAEWLNLKNRCTSLMFKSDCTISEIGDYAFSGMSNLAGELDLPDAISKIGNYAFFHCGFTGDLVIPSGTTFVGDKAFYSCSKLSKINAQAAKNMTWGYGAFANCVNKQSLLLPVQDAGTDLAKVFNRYYVQDITGMYLIEIDDNTSESTVLPGDKIYIGRLEDEKLALHPYYDFHYLLTTGHTDTADNIRTMATTAISNVATIDESGCITISANCAIGTEFTVVVMDNYEGAPDYDVYDSNRFIHFTVGAINNNFAGGIGTKQRPYLIKNGDQLARIASDLSSYYRLISNIDFAGESLSPLGTLIGGLDGNGYSITGFEMKVNANVGLFEQIAENAYVKNLTIGGVANSENYLVTIGAGHNGGTYLVAGTICAINYGTIENCLVSRVDLYASRNVDWSNDSSLISQVGGIAGNNYGSIKNCVVQNSKINAESKTVKDNSPAKCHAYSGGLVGINEGIVNDCSSLSNRINGYTYSVDKDDPFTDWREGEARTYCAGLIADNKGSAINCYVYENTLDGTATGDGDEGTDVLKKETYFGNSAGTNENCTGKNVNTTYKISNINLITSVSKTNYYIGEPLSLYGLDIKDDYGNTISGYTISGFDTNKSGSQKITVSYANGYTNSVMTKTFNISVGNIVPETVVVYPKKDFYDFHSRVTVNDFTAKVYYNNGDVETMESLAQSESNIVRFSDFSVEVNTKDMQILPLSYYYAYMTTEGKVSASTLYNIYVAIAVHCDCSDTTKESEVAATKTQYGYSGDIVCSACTNIVEEGKVIAMLECTNHSYTQWNKYNDSQHYSTCDCGNVEYRDHRWNEGTITQNATHTATGKLTRSCYDCGATKVETIPPIATHNYNKEVVSATYLKSAATCKSPAVYYKSCECGAKGTTTFTYGSTTSHTYGAWENYDSIQHAHTCECGNVEYRDHRWNEGIVTQNATHTATGKLTKTCYDCGATKVETIPTITTHNYNKEVVSATYLKSAATCKSPAIYYKSCECGAKGTTTFTYGSTIEHTYGVWENYDSTQHIHTCTCGAVEYEDHAWDNGIITIEPTHDEEGELTKTCSVCQAKKTQSIPPLDSPEGEYIPGDISGDGVVNSKDTTRLMRYLADWDVEVDESALDVNGDGVVNSKDTTRLMRYLAGWDVELH